MNETTENFLKVMAEFKWPDPPKIFYRVYYDDTGHPITYSMADMPGNYINITKEDYQLASMDSRVINGRLVHPVKNTAIKMRPGNSGTRCHPADVCIIVPEGQPAVKWSINNESS